MPESRENVPEPEPKPEESIPTEEDEEESGEEESAEEDNDSEDERSATKAKGKGKAQNSNLQKLPLPPSSSGEEEDGSDSESESDSDSPPIPKEKNIKPIASKPDDPPKSSSVTSVIKKSESKPGVKRKAEKNSGEETKKMKKKLDSDAEEGIKPSVKKPPTQALFQRVWSDEDEIVILKGMMDYVANKNADPFGDVGDFLEFIKKSLHVDVSKTQLHDKMRRLKRKYENNASKEKNNGKGRMFSKPHEQTSYELSKKIWGKVMSQKNNGIVVSKSRSSKRLFNDEVKDDQEMKDDDYDVKGLKKSQSVVGGDCSNGVSDFSSFVEWVMNDGMKMVEDSKKEEMEKKWRRIKQKEIEILLEKTELISEQARLVVESMIEESEH